MDIVISNANNEPIYQQIYVQIKNQILSGALPEGYALPSIRGLAKDLHISVITTKRAYDELERDGFLVTVAGKGSYVATKNLDLVREAHLQEIERHLREVEKLATSLHLSVEEVAEMLAIVWEED